MNFRLSSPLKHLVIIILLMLITWKSVSHGSPSLLSPMPLLIVMPIFMGIPFIATLFFAPLFYCVFNFYHKTSLCIAFLLTVLSILHFTHSWNYGIRFQGAQHVYLLSAINIYFLLTFYYLYLKKNKLFSNLLLATWMFSCALPYLGELP